MRATTDRTDHEQAALARIIGASPRCYAAMPALTLSSYARVAAGDHPGAFADAGEAVALG